jgi:hypothetical protein
MDTMSRWLDAIAADTSARTARRKVAADRPADAADACFTADGTRHEGSVTLGAGTSAARPSPRRRIRGWSPAPATDDILQCQLKAVRARHYDAKLTPTRSSASAGSSPTESATTADRARTPAASAGPGSRSEEGLVAAHSTFMLSARISTQLVRRKVQSSS